MEVRLLYLLIWAELFLFLMAGNKLDARDVRKWGFLFKLLCNFMDVLFIFTIFWYCKEMYDMRCCKEVYTVGLLPAQNFSLSSDDFLEKGSVLEETEVHSWSFDVP